MSEKLTDAQKEQARIVAEQEDAQSAPPYPSQEQNDRAKLALEDGAELPEKPATTEAAALPDVEKTVEPEKTAAGYKTRATKAN